MKIVFVLEHSYKNEDHEDIEMIGVYSSKEKAEKTVRKFKKLPGFKCYPDGFNIDKYIIEEDNWIEGFGEEI
jgi:homoserine kinase type II